MWPRVVEIVLGIWLVLSPLVFPATPGPWVAANDLVCGVAVVILALASFWPRLGRSHFLIGLVALWLVGFGYLGFQRPGPPAAQNHITTGLLLLMFFVLPNHASEPPLSWQRFARDRRRTEA